MEKMVCPIHKTTYTWLSSSQPQGCFKCIEEEQQKLLQENERLKEAIRTHRSQKADDRCIEDDDRLYEALGDGIKCDRRVGDKAAMLANCQRFIERRCEGGGWPTYAELEAKITQLEAQVADSDLIFGAGWQESLKAVHGDPHQAVHSQLAKTLGDLAIAQEEVSRLRAVLESFPGRCCSENDWYSWVGDKNRVLARLAAKGE